LKHKQALLALLLQYSAGWIARRGTKDKGEGSKQAPALKLPDFMLDGMKAQGTKKGNKCALHFTPRSCKGSFIFGSNLLSLHSTGSDHGWKSGSLAAPRLRPYSVF